MDWHRIRSALTYYLRAKGDKLLHSPFLYELSERVLDRRVFYHDFDALEETRLDLEEDEQVLEIQDFGAGSTSGQGDKRSVGQIAQTSVKRLKYAEILFRLANWKRAESMLELGTSLGLTTLYLAKACPRAEIFTLEGSPALVSFSRQLFEDKGCANIHSVEGKFEDRLPEIAPLKKWDIVFIDGNHRYEPTMEAVAEILPYAGMDAIFIMDDIYWSRGMTRAWNELCADPAFTLSVDLFEMGLLFRGLPMEKQHVVLRV